jgi:hypothetical protein
MASVVPFLFLGFLYVLLGAGRSGALAYCGTFTLARWVHSITYVAGLQPWRTVSFVVALVALVGLLVQVILRALG